jgi:hypothetical protein
MVVYTAIAKNRRAESVTRSEVRAPESDQPPVGKKEPEFINLNSVPVQPGSDIKASHNSNLTGAAGIRRDRLEIIRIAREMINNGASDEKIRNTLPISKGELALLNGSDRR